MCKVQVTCYISLMLVLVVNGKPFTSPYEEYLQHAIRDVTELEKMNINIENVNFYTPEDFSNEERRMEALGAYMAEMKVLQEENEGQNTKIDKDIDNIIKNLRAFAQITTPQKWEGYQLKSTQEFLKGLRELLQSMYSSLVTVERH